MKLITITFLLMLSIVTKAQNQVLGTWKTEGGKATVEIFKSGNYYYGKITALKTPLDDAGKAKTDKKKSYKS